jgi:hypothetical protein
MSRILRRPMFRGGSTSNEGIMSVPRKKYEEAGFVNEEEIGYDEALLNSGTITTNPAGLTISDSGIDLNKIDTKTEGIKQKYKALGQEIEEGSYSDLLLKEYLGNRSDPMGKFLINFGLNYMSARPRGGKFGALATAAEAAKKPTEQLYADQDTDRLLKLKLMSAIGKSETAGSFEKKVNFIWKSELNKPEGLRTFKSKEDVVDYIRKQESERKESSIQDKINEEYKAIRSKAISTGSEIKDMNKAEILQRDKNKLKNEIDKLSSTNTFGIPDNITKLPNSTDYTIPNAKKPDLDSFKVGRIYVDADSRMSFEYMGNNIFRPKIKL